MPDKYAPDLPLLVLRLPSADVVPVAEPLLMLSAQIRIMENTVMAEAELAAGSGVRLLVICPAPEAWIALVLAKGEIPSRAVSDWRESVRPLLRLLRAWRRQTVLLFDHTFASHPAACATALGLSTPEGPVFMRQTDDPVLVMIARCALRDHPAAQKLAEELAAMALSPAGTESARDCSADLGFDRYITGLRLRASAEAGLADAIARVAVLEAHLREKLQAGAGPEELERATQRRRAAAEKAEVTVRLACVEAEAELLREQVRLDCMALEQMQLELLAERSKNAPHFF